MAVIPLLYALAVYAQTTYPKAPSNFAVGQPVTLPWSISWTEGNGTVQLPTAAMPYFGQTEASIRVEWTPTVLPTTGISQRLLDIPNHLGIWIWNDGIHGEWYGGGTERRLFRTRWGLPAVGQTSVIEITWNSAGYAVIVDGILRIHDWQVIPDLVYPDPDSVSGVIGSRVDGTHPAGGTFVLTVNDPALSYDACSVDTVGAINETVPLDNTGAWSQGIDPSCL